MILNPGDSNIGSLILCYDVSIFCIKPKCINGGIIIISVKAVCGVGFYQNAYRRYAETLRNRLTSHLGADIHAGWVLRYADFGAACAWVGDIAKAAPGVTGAA